jgi:hypothetical protein
VGAEVGFAFGPNRMLPTGTSPAPRLQGDDRIPRVTDRDPEPIPCDAVRAREVAGRSDIDVMTLVIASDETELSIMVGIKPEIRATWDNEMPPDYPPAAIGLLPGDTDKIHRHRGQFERAARLLHPRRERNDCGRRPRWAYVRPGSYSLPLKPPLR